MTSTASAKPENPGSNSRTRELILENVISLFARKGFDGISMRDIARKVGIVPSVLYYYFPSKQALYEAAMHYASRKTGNPGIAALKSEGDPRERLHTFIYHVCKRMHEDPDYRILLQRNMIDCDEEIRRHLVEDVFMPPHLALMDFLGEYVPHMDKAQLATSIFSLTFGIYSRSRIRRHIPGHKPEHEDPETLANHIMELLTGNILSDLPDN